MIGPNGIGSSYSHFVIHQQKETIDALKRGNIEQVCIRPYRMALPQNLHWFEVDVADVIGWKEECLASENPGCILERIALDLRDVEARNRLFLQISLKAKSCLILTEGVIPYLPPEQVADLACGLMQIKNGYDGS